MPAADPSHPAPLLLHYDELPSGSDVRREFSSDGVTITVPASEPTAAALRGASAEAMLFAGAAGAGAALVGVSVGLAVVEVSRLDAAVRLFAAVLVGVIVLGVVGLLWRGRYAARVDVLGEARRQATVLHARADRLLVESAGPLGAASHDLAAAAITGLQVRRDRLPDPRGRGGDLPVACLSVFTTTDGEPLRLLAGRDESELRWIAAALGQALGKPVEAPQGALWRVAQAVGVV